MFREAQQAATIVDQGGLAKAGISVRSWPEGPRITPATFAERFEKAEDRTSIGDLAATRDVLDEVRVHVDGCGAVADGDDWLIDCTSQREIRAVIDVIIANL